VIAPARASRARSRSCCCVARPEAGLVANRLAVTGCSRGYSGAPKGTAPGIGEPGGDAEAAGRAAR